MAKQDFPAFFKFCGAADRQASRAIPQAIYDLFASQVRQLRNIVIAEVRTAFPSDQQAEQDLMNALEQLTGKQIELETSLHPELIGGLAVKIGDRIIDGSTTKQLQLLGRAPGGKISWKARGGNLG